MADDDGLLPCISSLQDDDYSALFDSKRGRVSASVHNPAHARAHAKVTQASSEAEGVEVELTFSPLFLLATN